MKTLAYILMVMALWVTALTSLRAIEPDSTWLEQSEPILRQLSIAENSALKMYYRLPLQRRIGLLGKISDRPIEQRNLGTNTKMWGVEVGAISLLPRRENHLIWGDLTFRREQTQNVVWNESNDRTRLYPYLTADSVGGSLSSNSYDFRGGYAVAIDSRWSIGADIAFDGQVSYRQIDPRPRNITAYLRGSVGSSFAVSKDDLLALTVEMGKYKQDNDLKFLSTKGGVSVYHLTGFSTIQQRFSGVNLKSFYSGWDLGSRFSWISHSQSLRTIRPMFSLYSQYQQSVKHLLALNNSPISRLSRFRIECQLAVDIRLEQGYLQPFYVWNASRKEGREHLMGSPAEGEYPILAAIAPYHQREYTHRFGLDYERKVTPLWHIQAGIQTTYHTFNETYNLLFISGGRILRKWQHQLLIGAQWAKSKWIWAIKSKFAYSPRAYSSLTFPANASQPSLRLLEEEELRYRAAASYSFNFETNLRYQITQQYGVGLALYAMAYLPHRLSAERAISTAVRLYF